MIDTQTHLQFIRRWTSAIRDELDGQLALADAASIQTMLESIVMINTLSGRAVKLLAGLAQTAQQESTSSYIADPDQTDQGVGATGVQASRHAQRHRGDIDVSDV